MPADPPHYITASRGPLRRCLRAVARLIDNDRTWHLIGGTGLAVALTALWACCSMAGA